MPGPNSTNRRHRPDTGSTDKKARKRLERRQAEVPQSGMYTTGQKTSFFRKPGSENRKK